MSEQRANHTKSRQSEKHKYHVFSPVGDNTNIMCYHLQVKLKTSYKEIDVCHTHTHTKRLVEKKLGFPKKGFLR